MRSIDSMGATRNHVHGGDRSPSIFARLACLVLAVGLGSCNASPPQVAPGTPPPLYEPAMAFDPASGQLLMFGGSGSRMYGDTWIWASGSWHQLHPAHHPEDRRGAAMVYDPVSRRLILSGGTEFTAGDLGKPLNSGGKNAFVVFDDTWAWDGADWQELQRDPPKPLGSIGILPDPLLAYDSTTQSLLRDALCSNDCHASHTRLSRWNRQLNRWDRLPAGSVMPQNEAGQSDVIPAALHSGRPVFNPNGNWGPSRAIIGTATGLLYVGQEASGSGARAETWSLANGAWHRLAAPGYDRSTLPSPLLSHTASAAVLMLDGFGETWTSDGSTWTRLGGGSPGSRAGAGMAFDGLTGQVVLFGGVATGAGGIYADTWAWKDGTWQHAAGPTAPQEVPDAWTQTDPPPSTATVSREQALQAFNKSPMGPRSASKAGGHVEIKLTRLREIPLESRCGPAVFGPNERCPEGLGGRLIWAVAEFCPVGISCGFSPTFGSPQPIRWALTYADAIGPDQLAFGSMQEASTAGPPGWSSMTDLATQRAWPSAISSRWTAAAVVLASLVAGLLLLLAMQWRHPNH